jgi:predicted alpha/beta-fold hydrolase
MPLIESTYQVPSFWFKNRHIATIFPSVFRRVAGVQYQRERLELADGDFLDLDWSKTTQPSPQALVVLTHGLLGDTQRGYMKAAVRVFNEAGFDALAWNHRGMSGESNRFERMTTHGSSDELAAVVARGLAAGYERLVLVGFSKGGNIALKYAGELGGQAPAALRAVVAVSAPCDIYDSLLAMGPRGFYTNIFRDKLKKFLLGRQSLIAPQTYAQFRRYQTLGEFMDAYVAPLHGFANEKDYCVGCSCLPVLPQIRVPSLILSAQDDPVLSEACMPRHLAEASPYLFLETPRFGGHCGFFTTNSNGIYWDAYRALEFVQEHLGKV